VYRKQTFHSSCASLGYDTDDNVVGAYHVLKVLWYVATHL